MDNVKIQEVAINMKLLKRLRFYQMFNPNAAKIKNWNINQLAFITYTVIIQLVLVYASFGIFVELDDAIPSVELVIVVTIYILNFLVLFMIIVVLYNANTIWELFDVTRFNFLKSKLCRKNIYLLKKSRDTSIRLTNAHSIMFGALIIQWILFPAVINKFMPPDTNQRLQNIYNLRFPVTLHYYNQHYVAFLAIEIVVTSFYVYSLLMLDVVLLSFCWVIIGQYEVIAQAFSDIGHENEHNKEEHYASLKSVLTDQIQLFIKFESFYFIWKPIVLIFVAVNSIFPILLSYALLLNFSSSGKVSFLTILRLGSSILYTIVQLFMFCYLFEALNMERESVNFGIYSCNWTIMDLKFKKLLLSTMQINNRNQIKIKASPKKIINLQLFASIMSTSFNMVSVLLKLTLQKRTNLE